jgi:hypothetical protein
VAELSANAALASTVSHDFRMVRRLHGRKQASNALGLFFHAFTRVRDTDSPGTAFASAASQTGKTNPNSKRVHRTATPRPPLSEVSLVRVYLRPLVIALGCVLACSAGRAFAQTVTDPDLVEFDPSPDHSALDSAGRPIVDHYELAVYPLGAGTPYEVALLGKPAPQSDGKIRVYLMTTLPTPLQPLVYYDAQIVAVGPGGSSVSNVSNTFVFSGPCSYTTSPSNLSFTAAGGTGTIDVTAGVGCVWSAGSSASWLSVSPTGGTGNGRVTFTVAPTPSSRSATINIAGQSLTVTQAGTTTTPVITSVTTSPSPLMTGQTGTITISGSNFNASTVRLSINGPGCAPCSVPNSWLTTKMATRLVASLSPTAAGTYTVSAQNGAGGPVSNNASFTVGSNPVITTLATAPSPLRTGQTGTLTITGSNFNASTVRLLINRPLCAPCTLPNSWLTTKTATRLVAGVNPIRGGLYTVSAQNGAGTPVSNAASLTVDGATRTTVDSLDSQSASFGLGTESAVATQAGVACEVSISASIRTFSSSGGTGRIDVHAPRGCAWTALSTSPWLTPGSGGVGSGSAAFTVAGNPASLRRSASISVGSRRITITQSGEACTISISSASQTFSSAGGSGSVNVSAPEGCSWTPRSSAAWLTPGSGGTGNGSVGFTVAVNPTSAVRSASLTIANQKMTVTEAGSSSSASLSPGSQPFSASNGNGTLFVTMQERCAAMQVSSAACLTLAARLSRPLWPPPPAPTR